MIFLLVLITNLLTAALFFFLGGRTIVREVIAAGLMPILLAYKNRALGKFSIQADIAEFYYHKHISNMHKFGTKDMQDSHATEGMH